MPTDDERARKLRSYHRNAEQINERRRKKYASTRALKEIKTQKFGIAEQNWRNLEDFLADLQKTIEIWATRRAAHQKLLEENPDYAEPDLDHPHLTYEREKNADGTTTIRLWEGDKESLITIRLEYPHKHAPAPLERVTVEADDTSYRGPTDKDIVWN